LTEKEIIGDLKTTIIDWIGNEIAVYFHHEGKRVGIFGGNYKRLVKLSHASSVSRSFMAESI
jgi:hypothetical protein